MRLATIILTGLGLVALASSTPASTSDASKGAPSTFWLDTDTRKYHCAGKNVICCEISTGGSCVQTNSCETGCFKHDNGTACVDMGKVFEGNSSNVDSSDSKDPTSSSDDHVAARNASPQEDLHYICSKNRRSVLICKYRFCSTDHYCKSNEECRDGPASCKQRSPSAHASKSEVRSAADCTENPPPKVVTRSRTSQDNSTYVCSRDRASVLKCAYGFCATDYYCAKGHPCVDKPARCKKA